MPPDRCDWPSPAETVGNFFAYDVMHGFTGAQNMGPEQCARAVEVTTAVVEPNSPARPTTPETDLGVEKDLPNIAPGGQQVSGRI